MNSNASGEALCLERLQREAFNCLEIFPQKIVELNATVDEYLPKSVRNNRSNNGAIRRTARCKSTVSTIKDYDTRTCPEFDVPSYYSLSICEHNQSHHEISKRKYYRLQGVNGFNSRRKPGPLGQLLKFIVGRLMSCTKQMVIVPSQLIIDSLISTFFQGRGLKSVKCGSSNWEGCLSKYVATDTRSDANIENLIDFMRPAVVQLIAHTTVLKRWLKALTLRSIDSLAIELTYATRSTETIDCWAYELFFHLKYLQVNRARQATDKMVESGVTAPEEVIHVNLWHRLVQLRNNYILLYEIVRDCDKIRKSESVEQR